MTNKQIKAVFYASFVILFVILLIGILGYVPFLLALWGSLLIGGAAAFMFLNMEVKSVDQHIGKIRGDFPKSRNFERVVFGGTKEFLQHGNRVEGTTLFVTAPLRPLSLNIEFAMRYFSLCREGGTIEIVFDAADAEPRKFASCEIAGLHGTHIQKITGKKMTERERRFPFLFNPLRASRIAAFVMVSKYPWIIAALLRLSRKTREPDAEISEKFAELNRFFTERRFLFHWRLAKNAV